MYTLRLWNLGLHRDSAITIPDDSPLSRLISKESRAWLASLDRLQTSPKEHTRSSYVSAMHSKPRVVWCSGSQSERRNLRTESKMRWKIVEPAIDLRNRRAGWEWWPKSLFLRELTKERKRQRFALLDTEPNDILVENFNELLLLLFVWRRSLTFSSESFKIRSGDPFCDTSTSCSGRLLK